MSRRAMSHLRKTLLNAAKGVVMVDRNAIGRSMQLDLSASCARRSPLSFRRLTTVQLRGA
jgi:hypothetical protein